MYNDVLTIFKTLVKTNTKDDNFIDKRVDCCVTIDHDGRIKNVSYYVGKKTIKVPNDRNDNHHTYIGIGSEKQLFINYNSPKSKWKKQMETLENLPKIPDLVAYKNFLERFKDKTEKSKAEYKWEKEDDVFVVKLINSDKHIYELDEVKKCNEKTINISKNNDDIMTCVICDQDKQHNDVCASRLNNFKGVLISSNNENSNSWGYKKNKNFYICIECLDKIMSSLDNYIGKIKNTISEIGIYQQDDAQKYMLFIPSDEGLEDVDPLILLTKENTAEILDKIKHKKIVLTDKNFTALYLETNNKRAIIKMTETIDAETIVNRTKEWCELVSSMKKENVTMYTIAKTISNYAQTYLSQYDILNDIHLFVIYRKEGKKYGEKTAKLIKDILYKKMLDEKEFLNLNMLVKYLEYYINKTGGINMRKDINFNKGVMCGLIYKLIRMASENYNRINIKQLPERMHDLLTDFTSTYDKILKEKMCNKLNEYSYIDEINKLINKIVDNDEETLDSKKSVNDKFNFIIGFYYGYYQRKVWKANETREGEAATETLEGSRCETDAERCE